MIEKFETVRDQLSELAPIINSFKSEAVQLRLIELILDAGAPRKMNGGADTPKDEEDTGGEKLDTRDSSQRPKRKRKTKPAEDGATPKPRSTSGKVGAGTTLNELIASGYFSSPRLIGEMVKHSADTLARQYKASDFSPMLVRAVRDKKLTRKKNDQGQYEYQQP